MPDVSIAPRAMITPTTNPSLLEGPQAARFLDRCWGCPGGCPGQAAPLPQVALGWRPIDKLQACARRPGSPRSDGVQTTRSGATLPLVLILILTVGTADAPSCAASLCG